MPRLDTNSGKIAVNYAFWLNIALLCGAGLMIILSSIMFYFGYDVTHILLDFTRMAKTIHRIKFVNVNQTPLVEFFLASVYNIYQTSLDKPRDEVDKYQKAYRGRLTEIGVPVFPLVNFADKFLIYLIVNLVFMSFNMVAKYISVGRDPIAIAERKIIRTLAKIKLVIILLIVNDLVFASSRNLLHYQFNLKTAQSQATQYFILTFMTLVLLMLDLTQLTVDSTDKKVKALFLDRNKFVRLKLSRKSDYEKDLKEGKVNEDGTKISEDKPQRTDKDLGDFQEEIIELNAYEKKKKEQEVPAYIYSKIPDNNRLIEIQNMVKKAAIVRAQTEHTSVRSVHEKYKIGLVASSSEDIEQHYSLAYGQDFDKPTRERIKKELEPWRFPAKKTPS